MNIWLNFLIDSLAFGAVFMYGSTGEILTEKAGHLNLGIPGIMCMGGAGGCLVLNMIGKSGLPPVLIVILGILGAIAFSVLAGLIYSFLTVTLRANQNVTGLTLTTFGVGLSKVIMTKLNTVVYLVSTRDYFRWPFGQPPAVGSPVFPGDYHLPDGQLGSFPDPDRPPPAGGRRKSRHGGCCWYQCHKV